MKQSSHSFVVRASIVAVCAAGLLQIAPVAQDRLPSMPGYQQFQKINSESRDAVRSGALSVTWKDATTFEGTLQSAGPVTWTPYE